MKSLFLDSLATAILMLLVPFSAWAQEGLAVNYLRDAGIADDPDVIFAEDFEDGANPLAVLMGDWNGATGVEEMELAADIPAASGGKSSLLMKSIGGQTTGGMINRGLMPAEDLVYLRYYIKMGSGTNYHHTGGALGGGFRSGAAGIKPSGADRFPVCLEGKSSFNFYIYWMEMRCWGDPAQDQCHGNNVIAGKTFSTSPPHWTCIEVMVKVNNPVSSRNGELALWIDGQQIVHFRQGSPTGRWSADKFYPDDPAGTPFEGFRWRSDESLKINFINLQHYVSDDPAGNIGEVWYDDVVVARKYIGPINTSAPGIRVAPVLWLEGMSKASGSPTTIRWFDVTGREISSTAGNGLRLAQHEQGPKRFLGKLLLVQ